MLRADSTLRQVKTNVPEYNQNQQKNSTQVFNTVVTEPLKSSEFMSGSTTSQDSTAPEVSMQHDVYDKRENDQGKRVSMNFKELKTTADQLNHPDDQKQHTYMKQMQDTQGVDLEEDLEGLNNGSLNDLILKGSNVQGYSDQIKNNSNQSDYIHKDIDSYYDQKKYLDHINRFQGQDLDLKSNKYQFRDFKDNHHNIAIDQKEIQDIFNIMSDKNKAGAQPDKDEQEKLRMYFNPGEYEQEEKDQTEYMEKLYGIDLKSYLGNDQEIDQNKFNGHEIDQNKFIELRQLLKDLEAVENNDTIVGNQQQNEDLNGVKKEVDEFYNSSRSMPGQDELIGQVVSPYPIENAVKSMKSQFKKDYKPTGPMLTQTLDQDRFDDPFQNDNKENENEIYEFYNSSRSMPGQDELNGQVDSPYPIENDPFQNDDQENEKVISKFSRRSMPGQDELIGQVVSPYPIENAVKSMKSQFKKDYKPTGPMLTQTLDQDRFDDPFQNDNKENENEIYEFYNSSRSMPGQDELIGQVVSPYPIENDPFQNDDQENEKVISKFSRRSMPGQDELIGQVVSPYPIENAVKKRPGYREQNGPLSPFPTQNGVEKRAGYLEQNGPQIDDFDYTM